MRLLHTGDWHLGRGLHGEDLLEAQRAVLSHLVGLAAEHAVDAVLVAGDVHDRAVPPVEAVLLLEETLARLAEHAPVVLISGNHDSATRLGYGSRLFRGGVHVRTALEPVGTALELRDDHGPVRIYPVPFLDPDVARRRLADPGSEEPLARSHEAVFAAALGRVREDLRTAGGPRSVVVAHAFVAGGEACDSERDIRVGGVESVPSALFRGIDYVALGHLHGAQDLPSPDGRTRLHYAGSPLRFSFSEARQRKTATLVTLGPAGVEGLERLPLPQPRGMATLRGPLEDLLAEPVAARHAGDWVQVTVTDRVRPERMVERVRARLPRALVVRHQPELEPGVPAVRHGVRGTEDPADIGERFVRHVTGGPPSAAERAAFARACEAARAAERAG